DLISVYLTEGEGSEKEAVLQVQGGTTVRRFKLPKRIPYPEGILWEVIGSGDFGYYENATNLSFLKGKAGKSSEQHTLLSVPVKSDSETIGVINFSSFEKNSFTEYELSFLLSFGNQIGIAVAKAKAFDEIKRWKDNLLESEQRYHVLVEHTYGMICEISIDGRFLYISSKVKDLLGYEPEELVGRSIFEHIHADDLHDTRVAFIKATSTFSLVNVVFRYKHRNGGWRWLESIGKPFQTAAGDIRRVIASRDITESRLTEEEVLRVSRPESRFRNQAETPVSLMLVTHSTLLREGIRKMLDSEKDIRIVAETSNNREIVSLLEQKKPDVLFVDIGLPGLDITQTLDLIREK
ncbi:MAG: PAS domain S-box protein, partial [Thermodesulfobacteriota bacterium]